MHNAQPGQPCPDRRGQPPSPAGEKTPLWEDILIILAIVSLWPAVFRMENAATQWLMYAAIPAMGYVMWRRVRRLRRLFKNVHQR